jgi:DNA-binding NtrC family response regulator
MKGHSSAETKRRASELGVIEYLEKPFDADVLAAEIREAMASGARPRLRSQRRIS